MDWLLTELLGWMEDGAGCWLWNRGSSGVNELLSDDGGDGDMMMVTMINKYSRWMVKVLRLGMG